MGFLSRLSSIDRETWPSVEAAANQRYWDALALATASDNHRTGAVYLMGYTAEMLLKTAACRIHHVSRNIGIKPIERFADGAFVKTLHYGTHDTQVPWRGGNFHSLDGLSRHLIESRIILGREYSTEDATQIRVHAMAVGANWSETLRYKSVSATDDELHETYNSVTWLVTNYDILWS